MILGQSAATAAVIAINAKQAVQDVPYSKLRERLLKDGQVLEYSGPAGTASGGAKAGLDPKKLAGIVVDDADAKLTGEWKDSTASGHWVGLSYRHDGAAKDGNCTARFEAKIPKSGRYEVRLAYAPNANRSSKVPIEIFHAKGKETVFVNQQAKPPIDDLFVSLGVFEFTEERPATVVVSNREANGYVIIDAVQWLPEK